MCKPVLIMTNCMVHVWCNSCFPVVPTGPDHQLLCHKPAVARHPHPTECELFSPLDLWFYT